MPRIEALGEIGVLTLQSRDISNISFNPRRFDLLVLDGDRAVFSIIGPLRNDTQVERKVAEFCANGRDLAVCGVVSDAVCRKRFMTDIARHTCFTYIKNIFGT